MTYEPETAYEPVTPEPRKKSVVFPIILLSLTLLCMVVRFIITPSAQSFDVMFALIPFALIPILFIPKTNIRKILSIVAVSLLAVASSIDIIDCFARLFGGMAFMGVLINILWLNIDVLGIMIMVMYLIRMKKLCVTFSIITAALNLLVFILVIIQHAASYGYFSANYVAYLIFYYFWLILTMVSFMVMFIRELCPFKPETKAVTESFRE